MKRTFMVLLPVLLLLVNTLWAQSSRLEPGVVTGGGLRWTENEPNVQIAFSPLAGVSVLYKFTETFGLISGMEYQLKGSRYAGSIYYNLHYMNFPVCIAIMTDRKTKFYLHAGAYMAYLLRGKQMYGQINGTADFKRFDTGYCFEPGIAFPLHKNYKLNTGARYTQSVINISKKPFGNLLTRSVVLVLGFSITP